MNDNGKEPTREQIAEFAQYCMGSCHGDWSPEAEAIYDKVMQDDATFEFYRRQAVRATTEGMERST